MVSDLPDARRPSRIEQKVLEKLHEEYPRWYAHTPHRYNSRCPLPWSYLHHTRHTFSGSFFVRVPTSELLAMQVLATEVFYHPC